MGAQVILRAQLEIQGLMPKNSGWFAALQPQAGVSGVPFLLFLGHPKVVVVRDGRCYPAKAVRRSVQWMALLRLFA
jgi:hypothetical protein